MTALTGLASHREAVWVASAMSEQDVEVSRGHGGRAFPVRSPAGGEFQVRLVVERPGGVRPLLQRLRQPDAVVHPALPVGPLQRAGHPPQRDRGVRVRLQRRQRGSRAGGRGGAGGRRGARRDGPRLPPLHAPRPRAPRAPGRVPAPLHPHPVDPVGRVARAALPHPRGDLHRAARERHHRLPHALLPPQLPAVLRGPHGFGSGPRAGDRALRGARGVGAGVPAADRPPRHAPPRAGRARKRVRARAAAPAGGTS